MSSKREASTPIPSSLVWFGLVWFGLVWFGLDQILFKTRAWAMILEAIKMHEFEARGLDSNSFQFGRRPISVQLYGTALNEGLCAYKDYVCVGNIQ